MFKYSDIKNNPNLLKNYKSRDKISFICEGCDATFYRTKHRIQGNISNGYKHISCGSKCSAQVELINTNNNKKPVTCIQCSKGFMKRQSQINISKNNFCSRSCSATYNNKNKTHGTRRSKLEIWMEEQLPILYPDLEFHFNRKDAIGSELDIYIPSLKLAFELNGIFHYEPIYGDGKLNQIQSNDQNKFQACQSNGISLCIINTSGQKRFTDKSSQKYLDIIKNIIG